ncbi:MAG: hypothetical protein ROO76_23870 [Terriglobia bacterium]|nr:hypothetical protein [Terriglobia bacterium]
MEQIQPKCTNIRGLQRRLGGEEVISHWSLRRLIKAGKINIIRIGERILIPISECERIEREGIR